MAEPQQGLDSEGLRREARESVRDADDIRARVHDLTLAALTRRRFAPNQLRDVVRAVTEGLSLGADDSRRDLRASLADALRGLDDALSTSVEAGQQALRQLVASGKEFTERDLKAALANLKRIEDDFVDTVAQVADAASDKARPALRDALRDATHAGTRTGRQVAATTTEFGRRFAGAALDVTLASVEVAAEVGGRFVQVASGLLAGMADVLQEGAKPRAPRTGAAGAAPAPASDPASTQPGTAEPPKAV